MILTESLTNISQEFSNPGPTSEKQPQCKDLKIWRLWTDHEDESWKNAAGEGFHFQT